MKLKFNNKNIIIISIINKKKNRQYTEQYKTITIRPFSCTEMTVTSASTGANLRGKKEINFNDTRPFSVKVLDDPATKS